jgi:hypothetical protein
MDREHRRGGVGRPNLGSGGESLAEQSSGESIIEIRSERRFHPLEAISTAAKRLDALAGQADTSSIGGWIS